jgi:hypothetical protein
MKSGIAIVALLCCIPLAEASEILFATDTNGDLIIINPSLQASALVGTNPDGISPIGITAQGPGPSKLWVFDSGTNNFVQLDNNNAGTVSTVFTSGSLSSDTVNEGDLAFTTGTTGYLAGIPSFGPTMTAFYSWDITNGSNSSLYNGPATGDTTAGQHAQMSGLAFCPAGICAPAGTLFGLEKPTDGLHLFTVSQADGSILTSVAITGVPGSYSVGGLAINPLTGESYVEYSNLTGSFIAAINLATGATSSPFAILPGQVSLVDGLTFADESNALPTPEPATALLLCIGAVALGIRRRCAKA